MRHQLLCSGSQWGHLGDQEIGRGEMDSRRVKGVGGGGGGGGGAVPSSRLQTVSSPQTRSLGDRETVCVVFLLSSLTPSPWPGEFANIFFSPPLDTITSLRDVLPYISPSQGVSRKYFQILTSLSGDTAGVNHVNVNFQTYFMQSNLLKICDNSLNYELKNNS